MPPKDWIVGPPPAVTGASVAPRNGKKKKQKSND
jgi:hypothetical protein